jgi:hypothetical protein
MQELPSIFDSRGTFRDLPSDVVDSLDDARRATYQKIKACAANLKTADDAVAASIENIKSANAEVTAHEKFIAATFPKRDFHSLWLETVKGA